MIGDEAKLEIALSCNWIPNVYARNQRGFRYTLLLIYRYFFQLENIINYYRTV